MTSRETLLDMGFDAKVVDRALKHSEELGAAIDWIENHPEAATEDAASPTIPAINPVDPKEPADAGASPDPRPISERLAEMQAKAAERKQAAAKQDALEKRRNEEISRKNQQVARDARRDLEVKQAQKLAAQRRKEAHEDKLYKEKLRQQIEQDKRDRLARQDKSATPPTPAPAVAPPVTRPPPTGNVRLRAKFGDHTVTKSYPPDFTVAQLGEELAQEFDVPAVLLTTTHPPSTVNPAGDGRTLRDAGLANANIIVKYA